MEKLKELYEKLQEIIIIILLLIIIAILCFILYKVYTKKQTKSDTWIDIIPKVSAKKIEEIENNKPIKVDKERIE